MAENLSKETFSTTKSKRRKVKCENHLSEVVEDARYEDYVCPICLQLLIEPVVMPCKHELCKLCFIQNVQEANLQCPICRVRISSWSRRQARNGTLICQKRWELIQKLFPEKCERRLRGEDDDGEDCYCHKPFKRILSENGEIRSEYEEEMRKIRLAREEEFRASEEFIHRLMEEDKNVIREMEQLREKDEEIARKIHLENVNETQVSTPVKSGVNNRQSVSKAKVKSKTHNSLTLERWFSPSSRLKSTPTHKADPSQDTTSQSSSSGSFQDNTSQGTELKIKQEENDFAFALRLQQQFDKERGSNEVERKKGTIDGYMLRKHSSTNISS